MTCTLYTLTMIYSYYRTVFFVDNIEIMTCNTSKTDVVCVGLALYVIRAMWRCYGNMTLVGTRYGYVRRRSFSRTWEEGWKACGLTHDSGIVEPRSKFRSQRRKTGLSKLCILYLMWDTTFSHLFFSFFPSRK